MNVLIVQAYVVSDADADFTVYGGAPPIVDGQKAVLEGANWTPDATLATDGTNYAQLYLKKGSTAITKKKNTNSGQSADATNEAGAAFTAGTGSSFSVIGTGADLEFSNTQSPIIEGDKGGSGGVVVGRVGFRYRIQRSAS